MLAKTSLLRLSPLLTFMTRHSLTALLVVFALALALPAQAAPLAGNQTIKLASGHVVKILSVSKIEYSKGVMALLVRYQTTLSVDERKELSQEVDEFWKFAQKDVERYKYNDAIISSNEVPKGVIFTASRMANFIYEKDATGHWNRLDRNDLVAAQ